jgi:hypothetical protein
MISKGPLDMVRFTPKLKQKLASLTPSPELTETVDQKPKMPRLETETNPEKS